MIDWLLRPDTNALQVEIDGRLVPLNVIRRANARRMTMRVAPDGSEVRVTLPQWGRSAEALRFARTKADWIAAQLAAAPPTADFAAGASLMFCGEAYIVHHLPDRPRRVQLGEGTITVGGPADSLNPRLIRWLQAEARRVMTQDLTYYCLRAAQPVPKLALSSAQRRWGSCARDGTIRLNWRLIMAPSAVRRSVVAHEVAHLVHFDHSAAFHANLGELFEGDLRAANRWLKREGRGLYGPLG